MAHTVSARKRIRQNTYRNSLNRWRKRRIQNSIKAFESAVNSGDAEAAAEKFRDVAGILDQVAAHGTIHRNRAARKKSRLHKRLKAMQTAGAGS